MSQINKNKESALSSEKLRSVLHYDAETGIFTRLKSGGRLRKGDRCGGVNARGYEVIQISGSIYYSHRLAHLWITGEWPKDKLDHADLDRRNNVWKNLRPANSSQNGANSAPQKNKRSPYKGVSWHAKTRTWQVRICCRRISICLGYFLSEEEAHLAYCKKAKELFGEFARAA